VGGSEGRYSDGAGEQEDVCAAVAVLKQRGHTDITLSGYSFGTWVNALCAGTRLKGIPMTMVAPPTAFMDFAAVSHLTGLKAVVTGSRDDIAPPDMLTRLAALWNPNARLEILAGADHFFFGYLEALEDLLARIVGDAAVDPAGVHV
jgi:alpha/beta superfamily hydrolase